MGIGLFVPVSWGGIMCRYGFPLAISIRRVKVQRGTLAFHTNVTHSRAKMTRGVGGYADISGRDRRQSGSDAGAALRGAAARAHRWRGDGACDRRAAGLDRKGT